MRSIVRGKETERTYARKAQPLPKLGAFAGALDKMLESNARGPKRGHLTSQHLYEELEHILQSNGPCIRRAQSVVA